MPRKAKVLFLESVRNLGRPTKEVKVLANGPAFAERVVVEGIIRLVQLVTQAVICFLKLEGTFIDIGRVGKTHERVMSLGKPRGCRVVARHDVGYVSMVGIFKR